MLIHIHNPHKIKTTKWLQNLNHSHNHNHPSLFHSLKYWWGMANPTKQNSIPNKSQLPFDLTSPTTHAHLVHLSLSLHPYLIPIL